MNTLTFSDYQRRAYESIAAKQERLDLWLVAIKGLTAFAISFGVIFGILCGVIAGVKVGHKVAPIKQYVVKK